MASYLGSLNYIIRNIKVNEKLATDEHSWKWPNNGCLDIPNGETSICNYMFLYRKDLKFVNIPSSVTSIGYHAFFGCHTLEYVAIQDGVTYIGEGAFSYCEGLKSINIPNTVQLIGRDAFNGCRSLRSITIPDSVQAIELDAFGNSSYTGLREINVYSERVKQLVKLALRFSSMISVNVIEKPQQTDILGQYTKQDLAEVQYQLGLKYYNGDGLPKNDLEAARAWSQAAFQGHAIAQYCMGILYYNGEGLPNDESRAIRCFFDSASNGYTPALDQLHIMANAGSVEAQNALQNLSMNN